MWKIDPNNKLRVIDNQGNEVARINAYSPPKTAVPRNALIAAAPIMYAALKRMADGGDAEVLEIIKKIEERT